MSADLVTWLKKNTFRCARYRISLTWERCQEYRQSRPDVCADCNGPVRGQDKARKPPAKPRTNNRKTCKICGKKRNLNRWGFCKGCNFRRFGGAV